METSLQRGSSAQAQFSSKEARMETPHTKAVETTEQVMAIFWNHKQPPVRLTTEQYNAIYSHVLDTLRQAFDEARN